MGQLLAEASPSKSQLDIPATFPEVTAVSLGVNLVQEEDLSLPVVQDGE
jgi:hypothetical protein